MNNLQQQIKVFDDRQAAITFSDELTPQGKTKELEKIRAEVLAFRRDALAQLKSEWQAVRARYKALATAQAKADDEAGARWDYVRLAYMKSTVENAGKAARTFQEFYTQMRQAINSGDNHQARAWAEFAPAIARERFGDKGNGEITREAGKALSDLLTTPALAKAKADGEAWVKDVLKLHNDTMTAAKFYGARADVSLGIKDEFMSLAEGVKINESFDAMTGTNTTISIE